MSGSVTFLELINQSKDRADMTGSSFVTDPQWKEYINKSKDVLYGKLVAAYGDDYYTTSYSFPLVGGTSSYPLPADFFKLNLVELDIGGGEFIPLDRFTMKNRNRGYQTRYYETYQYRLIGSNIEFTPNPSSGNTINLWYTPFSPNLVNDGDTLNGFNGWEEFIIIDAAIKAMRKEESDTTELERDRLVFIDEFNSIKQNRDASNPKRVKDKSRNYENDGYSFEVY